MTENILVSSVRYFGATDFTVVIDTAKIDEIFTRDLKQKIHTGVNSANWLDSSAEVAIRLATGLKQGDRLLYWREVNIEGYLVTRYYAQFSGEISAETLKQRMINIYCVGGKTQIHFADQTFEGIITKLQITEEPRDEDGESAVRDVNVGTRPSTYSIRLTFIQCDVN